MSFIQPGALQRSRIPRTGESDAPQGRRVTAAGAWKLGGLVGAIAYSLVCWTLLYHGGRAVIAWTKPEHRLAASAAEPATNPPARSTQDAPAP